ncbi:hypothetical protein [endosymbiont GvMRE of Glomus versiforme]|uniref:hypothetical protein n=1 Tax=endosymbiont GvMRE of Glomus versiforme TaxID=2039283 RepID=UPI0011C49595|nr:hypothetical protein [endosymbiont GvMRE of Glomus versiforme]
MEAQNNNLKVENSDLRHDLSELSKQNAILYQEKHQIQQKLTTAKETISQLTQDLASEQEKRNTNKANLIHEKQVNSNLHQQLRNERETNTNLTQKIHAYEQNLASLQNAYQNAIKDKQLAENQLSHLLTEIKKAAQQFQHWQKLNYYQQLEREHQTLEAKIIHPPPWKKN